MVGNAGSLQETTIKEETEGLGIEYTNYSPDYSLYQRDYVATAESEPVETGRSRYRIHRWWFQHKFGVLLICMLLHTCDRSFLGIFEKYALGTFRRLIFRGDKVI